MSTSIVIRYVCKHDDSIVSIVFTRQLSVKIVKKLSYMTTSIFRCLNHLADDLGKKPKKFLAEMTSKMLKRIYSLWKLMRPTSETTATAMPG